MGTGQEDVTMTRRIALALAGLLALAVSASAQPVDPYFSHASIQDPHPFTLAPCGGDPIPVIEVLLVDPNNDPVELPATDIWLQGGDVGFCNTLTFADSSTFAPDPGHTTFSGPRPGWVLPGRDCDNLDVLAVAVGTLFDHLTFQANGPDLNGDGAVTVTDFSLFAPLWLGTNPCADFYEDGVINLSDFASFASWFNACSCD
jgi:hypothetical protein